MPFNKHYPKIFLIVSLLCVYLATIARGLTWSNNGADGGDLISAAATGGVAHPSGYPTYLILARLFQYIPVGSLAFRTNLLSTFAALCVALMVYELVSRENSQFASLVSAYAIGLSPMFWSQAVITEVHTLHLLFVITLLFLSEKNKNTGFPLGIIFGLGLGNHITIILLFPILFSVNRKILFQRFAGVVLGSLIYLTLPLRAISHPLVNWGNPVTFENFIWLISGKLYQGQLFASTIYGVWGNIRAIAALFLEQFGLIGLIVGFVGLIVHHKPSRLNRNMFWISAIYLVFPLSYNTRDSFLYLMPVFLCFAIWIGVGINGLMEAVAHRFQPSGLLLGLTVFLSLIISAGGHWSQVDASHDDRAEVFGNTVMTQLPENAIVFASGDQAVLALWYFHYALKERGDIVVIAPELLSNEWYQQMIRANYPTLTLPDYFMFPEVIISYNPGRDICYVEYNSSTQMTCALP